MFTLAVGPFAQQQASALGIAVACQVTPPPTLKSRNGGNWYVRRDGSAGFTSLCSVSDVRRGGETRSSRAENRGHWLAQNGSLNRAAQGSSGVCEQLSVQRCDAAALERMLALKVDRPITRNDNFCSPLCLWCCCHLQTEDLRILSLFLPHRFPNSSRRCSGSVCRLQLLALDVVCLLADADSRRVAMGAALRLRFQRAGKSVVRIPRTVFLPFSVSLCLRAWSTRRQNVCFLHFLVGVVPCQARIFFQHPPNISVPARCLQVRQSLPHCVLITPTLCVAGPPSRDRQRQRVTCSFSCFSVDVDLESVTHSPP